MQSNIVVETQTQPAFDWRAQLSPTKLNAIPGRYFFGRRHSHHKQPRDPSPSTSIADLQTSFRISDSFESLRTRKWSVFDVQYAVIASLTIFSIWIIEPSAPFIKTLVALGYTSLLFMPITRQFFLPSWIIWSYLLYFFSSRFIPYDVRPDILVKVLPALEDILYGTNFSNKFSAWTHPVLDLLAWFPYGIGHFSLPAICSAIMFIFAAPGTLPMFAKTFGWMNALGVTIQLLLPCTPPWYERLHGLEPARYGMQGSPAGLARIDALFGVDMYTTSFTTAPVPFGAFPSLHAAAAILEALFISHCFPRLRGFCIFYVCWICWATMYLNHHYAVDLLGGGIIACSFFFVVKRFWLPRPQEDKRFRWEYEFVEIGQKKKAADEEEAVDADDKPAARRDAYELVEDFSARSSFGLDSGLSSGNASGSSSPRSSRSERRTY